jgi:replicative DNA helicase
MSEEKKNSGPDLMKSMPFSNDAEKGVLSCFLHNPSDLLPDAMSTMEDEWFYHPGNRLLFEQMKAMMMVGKPVEYLALSQWLNDLGQMDKVGGQGVLAELLDFVPVPTHYGYYKGILRTKWLLRLSITAATTNLAEAYEAEAQDQDGVVAYLTSAESRAFEVLQVAEKTGGARTGPLPIRQHLERWLTEKELRYKSRGRITGITTGIADLDRLMHGMDDKEGEVVVVGARPGHGKTADMVTLLHHAAVVDRIPCVCFSIEMTANQLNDRLVLGSMGIDTGKGNSGMFSRGDWQRLAGAEFERIASAPIFLDESSEINSADLRLRCQTLKRQHGVKIAFIDYLMLVDGVSKEAREDERRQIVEVMRTAAWIAKTLSMIVYVLVQLNRETDRKKKNEPPKLADLQGSAAIEQFAHHVHVLERPVMALPWHRVSDDAKEDWRKRFLNEASCASGQDEWVQSYLTRVDVDCWADGSKKDLNGKEYRETMDAAEAITRQNYEEHAIRHVLKNRRGPTAEVWMRYRAELTWFSGRTKKVYSNNAEERQVGSKAAEGSAPPAPARPVASQAHLKVPKSVVTEQELQLPEGHESGEDDRAER